MVPLAKSDRCGATRSVVGHCMDVALVVHALASRPVLRARLSAAAGIALSDTHLARLAVIGGLHDVGKVLAGFQLRISGRARGDGHLAEVLAVLAAVPAARDALRLELLQGWVSDVSAAMLVTVSHHGSPVALAEIQAAFATVPRQLAKTVLGHEPLREMRALLDALLDAFPQALAPDVPIPLAPAFQHLLAGLVMVADWMGSSFPLPGPDWRPKLAEDLLRRTGWDGWASGAAPEAVLGGRPPLGAQTVMPAVPLVERLVIIEAPTGTGKTEAALLHARRLVDVGAVDGLYFAVPTRSAATELHARIADVMTSAHPDLRGRVVRAVPGQIDTDPWQREDGPTWALGSPKRVLAAPVAVGTVDQAMLSALRVRHGWMRAALLCRHLLVIDEVHASDPYMAVIVEALIKRHIALGGHVLAMSATLGETLCARLEGRPRLPFEAAHVSIYPVVRAGRTHLPVPTSTERTVAVELVRPDDALHQALAAAEDGASVLVIRSTVDDAIATYQAVQRGGLLCLLHHSRWADEDRRLLDERLMQVMGKGGTRGSFIVVATQTAEQSLDIDADLLVTDACPADVLLQRLGRLHRHRTGTRPTVLVIEPGDLVHYIREDGTVQGRPGQGWAWVYWNLLSVDQTLTWLRTHGQVSVPAHSRALVERATHADHLRAVAEQYGGRWRVLWQSIYGAEAAHRLLGAAGIVDWSRPYAEAALDEKHVLTRLGNGRVTVRTPGLRSPLTGLPVEALPVPARWIAGVPPIEEARVAGLRIMVGPVQLEYGEHGLTRVSK